jgi:hypothetical protein
VNKIARERYHEDQNKFFYAGPETTIQESREAIHSGRILINENRIGSHELMANPKYGWLETFHSNIEWQKDFHNWWIVHYGDNKEAKIINFTYTEYIMGNLDENNTKLLTEFILEFMAYFI